MNWKECAALKERALEVKPKFLNGHPRFQWPKEGVSGFDCEPGVTISDIWGAISWVWTYPGDAILSIEEVKKFFEIEGIIAIGAVSSTILSWLILWFCYLNPVILIFVSIISLWLAIAGGP